MESMDGFLQSVVETYRTRAAERKAEGANTAALYQTVSDELAAMFDRWLHTPLSLAEAVAWSGYQRVALSRMKRQGIRMTRADLPRKPATRCAKRPRLVKAQ